MNSIEVRKKKRERRNFTQIDNAIFTDERIDPKMRYVYIVLWRYADDDGDNSFPSLSTICKITSFGRTTVNEAIKKLESLNLVERKNRKKMSNGKEHNDSNMYILDYANDVLLEENKITPVPQSTGVVPQSTGGSTGEYTINTQYNNTQYQYHEDELENFKNLFKTFEDVNFTKSNQESILNLLKKESKENVIEYLKETYENMKANPDIKNIARCFSAKIKTKKRQNIYKEPSKNNLNEEQKEIKVLTKKEKIQYVKDKLSQEELEAIYNSIKKEFNGLGVSEESSILSEMNEVLFRKYKKIAV